jgi:hypothetical protein
MTTGQGRKRTLAKRSSAALITAGLAISGVAAVTAAARNDDAPAEDTGPAIDRARAADQDTREFWTPERLARVEPMDMPTR